MTYLWESDAGGTFGNSTSLSTTWVAPTVTESTLVSLTLTANDGVRTGMATADVIVRPPATMPLALAAIADKTGVTGTVVNVQLPEATEGLAPYIYSASGLPSGLGLTGRRVRGLPIMPGTYTVDLFSLRLVIRTAFRAISIGSLLATPSPSPQAGIYALIGAISSLPAPMPTLRRV